MKLLYAEDIGGRVQNWWSHDGKLTVETVQDVEPIFDLAKRNTELEPKGFKFRGTVPATLLEETAKIKAGEWGVSVGDAFREIMQKKTDRANAVWKTLTHDRDYRKLQRWR